MLKDIKNIFILGLVLIIGILLFMDGCSSNNPNIQIQNDTVVKSDTIWAKDTVISFKTIIKPKHDTIYEIDTIETGLDPLDLFFTREYKDTLNDTNITIYSHSKVLGMLDEFNLKYKLKVPIKIIDSVFITKSISKSYTPRFSIYSGLETGGNTSSFNLSPYIDLHIKNKVIGYRYGLIDKTHNVKIGIRILKSRK